MKTHLKTLGIAAALTATAALAHTDIDDPQVQARMHVMMLIADDMKVLGAIAKGQSAFETEVVSAKAASLAEHARDIEALFKAQVDHPKSEAKDNIWSDWNGFRSKAADMEFAAFGLGGAYSKEDFATAFREVAKTCSACHEDYRLQKN